jgi:mannobiose 2-epimerase
MPQIQQAAQEIRGQMEAALSQGILPFWLQRCRDRSYSGYLLCFDEEGRFTGEDDKYLVTQSRMLWGFSHLQKKAPDSLKPEMEEAAASGFECLENFFWDPKHGGFRWQTARNGAPLDSAKLTYGQSFAIYALSEYYLCSGNSQALELACKTFELLQCRAADNANGGYFENLEEDWSLSPGGAAAGDRKSLDIHMHLLEAFTTLAEATGDPIHLRKLSEVTDLILRRMVNCREGYGYNQFDLRFRPIPAININRTWNADRQTGETIGEPADTTSYGHNVELSWLMDKAMRLTADPETPVVKELLDHALSYGYDWENGGVYRDGVACRPALVHDKEWWQNFESMAGFLNGYLLYGDARYWQAFQQTWGFVRRFFLHPVLGESRQLLDVRGTPIAGQLGNPWKGIYHTGRALAECLDRLDKLIETKEE